MSEIVRYFFLKFQLLLSVVLISLIDVITLANLPEIYPSELHTMLVAYDCRIGPLVRNLKSDVIYIYVKISILDEQEGGRFLEISCIGGECLSYILTRFVFHLY